MIECQRHLFDLPDDLTYLNCAYLAPKLKSVIQAGTAGLQLESRPWEIVAEHFFADSERVRDLFAQLISADPDDIALIPAASYGIATAAANIDVKPGQNIVVLAEQYPSNYYAWDALSHRSGARIVTVDRPPDGNWTPGVLAGIDKETAVVAVPNVHYTDGSLLTLPAVRDRCRDLSVALVLDLSQSLGVMPFSVRDIEPDFCITAGYKWLLGPYNIGFMYVSPTRQDGQPIEYNWLNRKNSEDFAGLVDYQGAYQRGARRFDVGERAKFMQMPMAAAALEQILDWGVSDIASSLAGLTSQAAELAGDSGLAVLPQDFRAPHILGVRFTDGVPPGLVEELRAEKVFVSLRGDSMRIAPHLCNDSRDIERLFDVLTRRGRNPT